MKGVLNFSNQQSAKRANTGRETNFLGQLDRAQAESLERDDGAPFKTSYIEHSTDDESPERGGFKIKIMHSTVVDSPHPRLGRYVSICHFKVETSSACE